MAPLPELKAYLTTLLRRTPLPSPTTSSLQSLAEQAQPLLKRTNSSLGSNGVTPFKSIPNNAVFALFGVIGAGFVLTGIWFFFWAKNGGFVFRQNDWDDYKSTVLRRKGPNGTTLSGATESTDLGGESIKGGKSIWGRKKKGRKAGKSIADSRYKDFDEESTGFTETTGVTESTSRWKLRKDRKAAKKESRLRGGDLASEMTEQTEMLDEDVDHSVIDAMRAYRHEKPARVGGLNTKSDSSAWDGSVNDNSTAASDLLSHREKTPTSTPTKERKKKDDQYTGGIRKVVSTSAPSRNFYGKITKTSTAAASEADTERSARVKAEAAKLQAKGRAATQQQQRRDFSFQAGDDASVAEAEDLARRQRHEEREARREARRAAKKVPGSYLVEGSEVGSATASSAGSSTDLGTKSYHHVIPGLSVNGGSSVNGSAYADERRKKRNGGGERAGGYRRGRRDSWRK